MGKELGGGEVAGVTRSSGSTTQIGLFFYSQFTMKSPESPLERDRFLLAQIERGGRARESAVAGLYHHYGAAFQRYFERHQADATEAEDLVQEVFIKIVRNAGQFRGDATPSAWLWSIARNTLISHHRGARVEFVDPPGGDEGDDPWNIPDSACPVEVQMDEEALMNCIRREFARFADQHADRAQALALVVFHSWQPNEVAQYLGRTAGATREYLSQCRKLLQPFLSHCQHFLADA